MKAERSTAESIEPAGLSLTARTLSGLSWSTGSAGVQMSLKVLILVVLARLVTPEEFGVVGAALVVVGFSHILSQLGVGPAIVQRHALAEEDLRVGFTLSMLLGLLLAVIIYLSAPQVARFFRMEDLTGVLRVLAPVFLIGGAGLVAEALLQREMNFRAIAGVSVVSDVLGYGVVGIGLAWHGWGVWALVGAHLGQTATKTIALLMIRRHPVRPSLNPRICRELTWFGTGLSIGRFGAYVATQGDNLIVGRLLGAVALGIYGRAYQFVVMPVNAIGGVLEKVLFPAMAEIQADLPRLSMVYRRGTALVALVTLPLSGVLAVLAPEIIGVLLGSAWLDVVAPFRILTLTIFIRAAYKLSNPLAKAMGAVYGRAWRTWVYAVAVTSGAAAGSAFGLSGVAWGVVFGLTAYHAMMCQLSLSLTKLSLASFAKAHLPGLCLAIIAIAVCFVIAVPCRMAGVPEYGVLGISLVGVSAILGLVSWLTIRAGTNEDVVWTMTMFRRYAERIWVSRQRKSASPISPAL
jgi:O-antigen/teichoic acid export membrane protein